MAPSTITSASLNSDNSGSGSGSSGLSSGARAGIIAGSVVGGVLALAAIIILCLVAKRRKNRAAADDGIRWPEIASSAEDRAALYPEQVRQTGKAGIGGDEMEEIGNGHYGGSGGGGPGAAGMLGAGAAGLGAGAFAGRRFNSTSSAGRQPTLPTVPPSIYSDQTEYYGNGTSNAYGYNTPSAYGGSTPSPFAGSTQSHAPLAPGPASIEYQRAMSGAGLGAGAGAVAGAGAGAFERDSPSPPHVGASSVGHGSYENSQSAHPVGSGALPLPGEAMGPDELERPRSPTEMQVGGAYGHGYDESDGGRRWRLSVVNDDPSRERD